MASQRTLRPEVQGLLLHRICSTLSTLSCMHRIHIPGLGSSGGWQIKFAHSSTKFVVRRTVQTSNGGKRASMIGLSLPSINGREAVSDGALLLPGSAYCCNALASAETSVSAVLEVQPSVACECRDLRVSVAADAATCGMVVQIEEQGPTNNPWKSMLQGNPGLPSVQQMTFCSTLPPAQRCASDCMLTVAKVALARRALRKVLAFLQEVFDTELVKGEGKALPGA
eukprot:1149562-Pelagomonas_calceolata.AAC.9